MSDPPPAHPGALPKGCSIAEYEIVRVLGAGGFGITYLAFDHQLDGPVAIKEYFPTELATRVDDEQVAATGPTNRAALATDKSGTDTFAWGLERFLEEARAVDRFRHPNVVQARRYLEANGTAYLVMEYVEGESLKSILDRRGHLSAEEWRPWMDALLDGLDHVHSHGYLHRDIKPANIVIRSEDGEPVLIDFGSARLQHRDRTHTQVLTAAYAPIEQHSTGATQGPPTDIYALAATSYRTLTGTRLSSVPDRILNDDYEPLADRIASAERQWLAAIDHGLAVRPENRPQTVKVWRTELAGTATAWSTKTRRSTAGVGVLQDSSTSPPEITEPTVQTGTQPARDSVDTPLQPARRWAAVAAVGALLLLGAALSVVLLTEESSPDGASGSASIKPTAPVIPVGTGPEDLPPEEEETSSASVRVVAEPSKPSARFDAEAEAAGDSELSSPSQPEGDENDTDALFRLGEKHYYGDGTAQDYGAAIEAYREAADRGHAAAQVKLGYMYVRGEGVPQDDQEAAAWYRRAAQQGHAGAQFNLGTMYACGDGVPQHKLEALAWFRKAADRGVSTTGDTFSYVRIAADQGEAEAQAKLGLMFLNGYGVPQDYGESVAWYREAASQGHAEAQYQLGEAHFFKAGVSPNREKMVEWYRRAADQGHVGAQYTLGLVYTPRDYGKAEEWFGKAAVQGHAGAQRRLAELYRRAADQGNARAQFSLGLLTLYTSPSPDHWEAAAWYDRAAEQGYAATHRKAAEQGNVEAQRELGLMYEHGYGVPPKVREAAAWYKEAADQGSAAAQFELGNLYFNGEGVPQDYDEAAAWFRKAAIQGHAGAQFNLGFLYDVGEGVPRDRGEATVWYREADDQGLLGHLSKGTDPLKAELSRARLLRAAASQGEAEAQFELGWRFRMSWGVPGNDGEAVAWYRMAANQGHALASFELGSMYENGEGVPQDHEEALAWFRRAANQGSAAAEEKLAGL